MDMVFLRMEATLILENGSGSTVQQPQQALCQQDCLLNLIELLWPVEKEVILFLHLIQWLEMTSLRLQMLNNLPGKRQLTNFLQPLKKIMKDLTKDDKNAKNEYVISYLKLKELLKAKDLYMMFCQTSLEVNLNTILKKVWEQNFMEGSTGGSTMTIMPTSSMTVAGPEGTVDVPESNTSLLNVETDECFDFMINDESTSLISQSISRNLPDSVNTVSSPGERGAFLIKLEIYNCKNIQNLPKNQWWRVADLKMNFLTQNSVDPLHLQVTKVVQTATGRIRQLKDLKKEVLKRSSYPYINSFRAHPY